jgi:ribosomal protein S18 acetylase RimI-like enzyme
MLKVRGTWPNQLALSLGWARASARPWNDDFPAVALRLDRGSARFLGACTDYVRMLGAPVLSPALLPARSRLWEEAGYEVGDQLALLEHDLRHIPGNDNGNVPSAEPGHLHPSNELYEIDQSAFPVRWRMGRRGLEESVEATGRSVVHRVRDEEGTAGFAVTGISLGQAYLQRLAVHPRAQRQGLGGALVRASLLWARHRGARAVLVNTQTENQNALDLYRQTGFVIVPGGLVVMSASRH